MSDRILVSDEEGAWADLGPLKNKAVWRERHSSLPFQLLSDDAFEVFCFVLLFREQPQAKVYYYGKTADGGRDIVLRHSNGTVEFVQCKRYSDTVGVGEVRKELAKLCVNTFTKRLPEIPDRVTFYVVPDLSGDAQDLLASQDAWRKAAPKALEQHLSHLPSAELLEFADRWWPSPDRVTGVTIGERVRQHIDLVDRFFSVRKVIDGSVTQILPVLEDIQDQIRNLPADVVKAIQPLLPSSSSAEHSPPLTRAQEVVGRTQARLWEDLARRSLDLQGQQLWEEIRGEIRSLNNARAIDSGRELQNWIREDGAYASNAIRGRVCILLAELAVIESAVRSLDERVEVAGARSWQQQAQREFGDSADSEDAARLVHLDARLTWIEGRTGEAKALLDEVDNPNCRSLKLAILLSERNLEVAIEVARALPFDDRWADRIVFAFALAGKADDVATVLSWAKTRSVAAVHHRCLVAAAQGRLQRILGDRDPRAIILESPSDRDQLAFREQIASLEPVLTAAIARGQAPTGVEAEALELALTIARALGQPELLRRYSAVLAEARPVSRELARAVSRGDLPAPADLATRLREDYPRSFFAGHLAAVLDVQRGAPFAEITGSADALDTLAVDKEQQRQVVEVLLEAALADEGTEAIEQARSRAIANLGEDHALVRAASYEVLRRSGREAEADALMTGWRDESNPVWHQLAAAHVNARGDRRAALGHLLAAARELIRPDIYQRAFALADALGDVPAMREVIQALARLTPEDPRVYHNLAAIEFRAGHFREAATALERFDQLAPGNAHNSLFWAQSLALAGQGDEAVRVLDRLCSARQSPVVAFRLRASVLDSLGRPGLAFDTLHAVRDQFWGDMGFVLQYHSLAYKANKEPEARLAFIRLHELQAGDPAGPLRQANLNDLHELMRNLRQEHEKLNQYLLDGRIPWLMAGHLLRREAYVDWMLRTQEVFVPDFPLARAEYAIYATNGFGVRLGQDDVKSLEPVACTSGGKPVIVDLSALITLHRLALLDRAIDYFGQVILPARYLVRFLEEHQSLQPHQPSQVEAHREILTAVDEGRLRPTPRGNPGSPHISRLDEYHLEEERAEFHLIDVVDWLHKNGKLTDKAFGQIGPLCRRPAATDPKAFPAAAATGIRVTVPTLTTFHGEGLLGALLDSVKLFLDSDEIEQLRQESLGVERRAQLARWNRELHAALTTDDRIESAEPTRSDQMNDASRESDPFSDILLLVEQRQIPLLADDRFLQTVVLNSRRCQPGAAFGTDCVLAALAAAGRITEQEWASAWLQLVRWRYRFLIPAPEVLLALSARHSRFPPGEELREVARYLHDCCHDPGLFCGPEPTDPPMPIAWRFFEAVVQSIGRFLMRAWHDGRFDDPVLGSLTEWSASEFLPSPPRHFSYALFTVACETAPRLLLMSALADPVALHRPVRSNAALTAITKALPIPSEEYDDTLIDLIEVDPAEPGEVDESDGATRFRHRLAFAAYHGRELNLREAAALSRLGLVDQPDLPTDAARVAALGDPNHPHRIDHGPGPWVFLTAAGDGQPNEACYIPDQLYHPNVSVRQAATAHLALASSQEAAWLMPGTREVIAAAAADVSGDHSGKSMNAARVIDLATRRDFLLSLAAFRQVRSAAMIDESNVAVIQIIEPRSSLLGNIPRGWYGGPGDEWRSFLTAGHAEENLRTMLDSYYERYGHLPLASRYGMETVVREWVKTHDEVGVWDEVWNWAGTESRPLKRYHACRVFLGCPGLVPEGARAAIWDAVADFLGGHETDLGRITPSARAWRLLHVLARHYFQVLAIESFDPDATGLAALAWWSAERVTNELVASAIEENDAAAAGELIDRLTASVRELSMRSNIAWTLGRPVRSPSAFGDGTVHVSSLWRPALLESHPGPAIDVPDNAAESVRDLLVAGMAFGYPPRIGTGGDATLALDIGFEAVVRRWVVRPQAEDPSRTDSRTDAFPSEFTFGETEAELRAIWDKTEDDRRTLLIRLRSLIGLRSLEPSQLQWLLDDRGWWNNAFDRLTVGELESICGTLFDFLNRGMETWPLTLPHILRLQAARENLSPDKRKLAAISTLQACVICGHTSALAILVQEVGFPELQIAWAEWRRRLEGLRFVVPPPVQARLRTVLALLPPESASNVTLNAGADDIKPVAN